MCSCGAAVPSADPALDTHPRQRPVERHRHEQAAGDVRAGRSVHVSRRPIRSPAASETVRDPQINSSDDLRAFIAGHPGLAAERGLRYSSYIQKSTAVAMATIIPIVDRPGRRFEVRLRDELRAEDMRVYDIVYVGPMARIGPLEANMHGGSRFRFDAQSAGITDTESGQVHLPEGDLADHHKDYALVTRFEGPAAITS